MERITVPLGYDICVGAGVLAKAPKLLKPQAGGKKAFFIVDSRLKERARVLQRTLEKAGWTVDGVSLPAKEASKDFKKMFSLYSQMIRCGMDRHSTVFAIGGGVIGDLAGFVAGTYMRGIRWVGVPTTLLAQVDSSIGGKTGVNHPLGKNLIGVFHQPSIVLCDVTFLDTLSKRDVVSGVGEIVKYGIAFDETFFRSLDRDLEKLLELEGIEKAVSESARWKAYVVGKDPYETRGLRALLNFGHTLGHALEASTGYGYFRHGEAIVWGMRWATRLSEARGHLSSRERQEVEAFLHRLPVPPIPKRVTLKQMLEYTKRDKKNKNGRLGFILLNRIGHAFVDHRVEKKQIAAAIK